MVADTAGVAGPGPTRGTIGGEGVHRGGNGGRPGVIAATGKDTGLIDRLPPHENMFAVGVLMVVGDPNTPLPIASTAVRGAQHTCATSTVTAVPNAMPGATVVKS
jgi:hypothetical protein